MKNIPKRPLIPILTDLIEYPQAGKNTIAYVRGMREKYGDVCEVSFTGIKNYFIHDPELIKEILTTQGPKMKRTLLFRAFRKFLGHGLFTSDDPYHKRQRRLIKPVFYPQRIESYASIMVACAHEEMAKWKNGDTIQVNQAMTRITLQVITRSMFGQSLNEREIGEVGKDLASAFDVMNRIIQNPFYVFCLEREIPIPLVRRFFSLKKRLDEVINRIIAAYRKEGPSDRNDLLALLMEARDEETGEYMTDEQIRDEVITIFIAGHETTTIALSWTWYLLGLYPEIAKQFYEEVRSVAGDRPLTAADYQALPLTKNIFRESLRLYPPAWTFAREPMEDLDIQGYHFPKGCVLWTITYLLHHDPKYFQDPEAFIPGRWEDENVKSLPRYAYIPFGGGNRMCIGEGFAWMEGVLVLATIGSRFRLELPQGFTTGINPVFTLKTREPVTMRAMNE